MNTARGLYIHLPFCLHKCHYCDFTIRVLQRPEQIDRYLQALDKELNALGQLPHQLETLYLGGGTPSLLNHRQIMALAQSLKQNFRLDQLQEWTLEVNPETGSTAYFEACLALGINRVSLGVQSWVPSELADSGRSHTRTDIIRCLNDLQAAGLYNISQDLIYGLPGQTLNSWRISLEQALETKPAHLSLYSLEVHEKTLWGWHEKQGSLTRPPEEIEVQMYEWACEQLAQAGYIHYEIANWCLPDRASRHNQLYWQTAPVLAAGVGAHGYWQGRRYAHSPHLSGYYQTCQTERWPWLTTPPQSRQEAAAERLILGLRLLQEGLDGQAFQRDFGLRPEEACPEMLNFAKQGLLRQVGENWLLSPEAVLISNTIFAALLQPYLPE